MIDCFYRSEYEYIKFPKDIEDAKNLGRVLSRYKDKFYPEVIKDILFKKSFLVLLLIVLFLLFFGRFLEECLSHICFFKRSPSPDPFSCRSSVVTCSISQQHWYWYKIYVLFFSFVFKWKYCSTVLFFQICFCSATGASFCYLLSYLAGRPLIHRYLPQRANDWSNKVNNQKSNIFSYILFLRITPFLPNWFINIVSPVIGVRLTPFWFGTFFGVAPPSFIAIQAGTTLQQLTSGLDALTFQSVALLVIFAFISILPPIIRSR